MREGMHLRNRYPNDAWRVSRGLSRRASRLHKEHVRPQMKSVQQSTNIEISLKADVPGFKASDDDPMVQLVKQITGQNASEVVAYGRNQDTSKKQGSRS